MILPMSSGVIAPLSVKEPVPSSVVRVARPQGNPKASLPTVITASTSTICMIAVRPATTPALASTMLSDRVGPLMRAFQLLPRCSVRQTREPRMAIPIASGNRP
ncbi:hypothetical protein KEM60_02499 [Austwickia sp. TVS 96-490-7B]|nr:hypothetical protein [Austwickia sp. TVS 96-490-7B]